MLLLFFKTLSLSNKFSRTDIKNDLSVCYGSKPHVYSHKFKTRKFITQAISFVCVFID